MKLFQDKEALVIDCKGKLSRWERTRQKLQPTVDASVEFNRHRHLLYFTTNPNTEILPSPWYSEKCITAWCATREIRWSSGVSLSRFMPSLCSTSVLNFLCIALNQAGGLEELCFGWRTSEKTSLISHLHVVTGSLICRFQLQWRQWPTPSSLGLRCTVFNYSDGFRKIRLHIIDPN